MKPELLYARVHGGRIFHIKARDGEPLCGFRRTGTRGVLDWTHYQMVPKPSLSVCGACWTIHAKMGV